MLYRATSDMSFSPPEKEISLHWIANVPEEEGEGISKIITLEYKQIYFRVRERRRKEEERRKRKGREGKWREGRQRGREGKGKKHFTFTILGCLQIKRCFQIYSPGMSPYTNIGFKYLFSEALNHTETWDNHGELSPNYHVSSTLNTLSPTLTITL